MDNVKKKALTIESVHLVPPQQHQHTSESGLTPDTTEQSNGKNVPHNW